MFKATDCSGVGLKLYYVVSAENEGTV